MPNFAISYCLDAAGIGIDDLDLMVIDHALTDGVGVLAEGVGIPHGKLKRLDHLVLGFGLSREGVDFESMDNRPTHIFFVLITPENSTGLHLRLLARISKILKNDILKERLMSATDPDEVLRLLREEDVDF